MKNVQLLLTISILYISCSPFSNWRAPEKYCGYEMTYDELIEISTWFEHNPNAYEIEHGSDIYGEINDSIRFNMPDTVDYELFLIKLTDNEVAIDAYAPNNEQFIADLACAFMRSSFSSLVPEVRKIRIYTYAGPDGSGDSPFAVGIKNTRNKTQEPN